MHLVRHTRQTAELQLCFQVAIEQLQQELATAKHEVEVVKSEARQVRKHTCQSRVAPAWRCALRKQPVRLSAVLEYAMYISSGTPLHAASCSERCPAQLRHAAVES